MFKGKKRSPANLSLSVIESKTSDMANQPAPQQLKLSWTEEIRYLKLPQQLLSLHHTATRMKTHHPQGISFDSI